MKTIFKGDNFVIQWAVTDSVTAFPFDFTGMFVDVIIYSNMIKRRLSNCTVNENKLQVEIDANFLPTGVYNIELQYKDKDKEGVCVCRNAFQITRNPHFADRDCKVVIESFAAPLKIEKLSDVNYLGHVADSGLLPEVDQPSWALVGNLEASRPYFYYVAKFVPPGYQQGWNDLSQVLGTYDLTIGKDAYQTNLFARFASYAQINGASVTKEDVQEVKQIINAISTNKVVSIYYQPSESNVNHFGTLDCYYNESKTEFGCYLPTEDGYVIARCNVDKPTTWALVNAASGNGSTGEGITNYNQLKGRPAINGVTLSGNHPAYDLDLVTIKDTFGDTSDQTDYQDFFQ